MDNAQQNYAKLGGVKNTILIITSAPIKNMMICGTLIQISMVYDNGVKDKCLVLKCIYQHYNLVI